LVPVTADLLSTGHQNQSISRLNFRLNNDDQSINSPSQQDNNSSELTFDPRPPPTPLVNAMEMERGTKSRPYYKEYDLINPSRGLSRLPFGVDIDEEESYENQDLEPAPVYSILTKTLQRPQSILKQQQQQTTPASYRSSVTVEIPSTSGTLPPNYRSTGFKVPMEPKRQIRPILASSKSLDGSKMMSVLGANNPNAKITRQKAVEFSDTAQVIGNRNTPDNGANAYSNKERTAIFEMKEVRGQTASLEQPRQHTTGAGETNKGSPWQQRIKPTIV